MPLLEARRSLLLLVDFQARLMPVIDGGEEAVRQAARLLQVARMLEVPRLFTEQNPAGLGTTVAALPVADDPVFHKFAFGACGEDGFLQQLPPDVVPVVVGCETHVCVLQTVLGLLDAGRPVAVVADAVGSRRASDKALGLQRMAAAGAQVVGSEMVLFEWLGSARHPRFREVMALIK